MFDLIARRAAEIFLRMKTALCGPHGLLPGCLQRLWLRYLRARKSGAVMLVALATISIIGCALVVTSLVSRLDEDAVHAETAILHGAVAAAVQAQAKSAFHTARWDDAVHKLYGSLDTAWASANISSSYVVYVIDARGRTLFSERADGTQDPPLVEAAPGAVQTMLRNIPRTLAEARRATTGFGFVERYRGRPSYYGVMPIIPLKGKYLPPASELRYLVFVDTIDDDWLAVIRDQFDLPSVRLGDGRGDDQVLPLHNPAGQAIAFLHWEPLHPGRTGLREIMPMLLAATAVVVILTCALGRLIRRQELQLIDSAQAHARIAQDAEAARHEAEAACRDAEELRRLAESAARGEALERQRSAQALKAAAHATGQDLRAQLSAIVVDLARSANQLDETADATWAAMRAQEEHAIRVGERSASAAASLDDIFRSAGELARMIGLIREEVTSTREAVAAAAEHSSAAAAGSAGLLEHVDGIGGASDVIAKVAKQTNLLALNAAIVSARSGSGNDSFAVIAREIKALSQSSRQSTGDIAGRLQAVSRAVQGSVGAATRIDVELQHIHESISKADDAVIRHEQAGEQIRSKVQDAHGEAHAVGRLIGEVAVSIAQVRNGVQLTRDVSSKVRERISLLEGALDKAVSDLLAA